MSARRDNKADDLPELEELATDAIAELGGRGAGAECGAGATREREQGMTDELPEGWVAATCSSVVGTSGVFSDGYWIESKDQDPQGNVRLVQLADVGNGEYRDRSRRFLTSEKATELGCTFLRPGDVLIARMPEPLGRACIFPGDRRPCITAVDVCIIRPSPNSFDPRWLLHTINSPQFRESINQYEMGTTRKRISRSNLGKISLPFPPLAEQQRIVAKVEALLARVNGARQRLAKVPAILKRFRQSVLDAACTGRLTADWRDLNPDVPTALGLLEEVQVLRENKYQEQVTSAVRNGKRRPKSQANNQRSDLPIRELEDLPASWTFARLADLTHLITDGTHKTPQYQEAGIPFLSVKNVRPFAIRDDEIKWISEKEHQEISSRCNPEPGDILYTKVGATFGYAAVNRLQYSFSLFVSVALIKPVQECFIPDYVAIALNSEIIFDRIMSSSQLKVASSS